MKTARCMWTLPLAGLAAACVILSPAYTDTAAADESGFYLGANAVRTLSTFDRHGLDDALSGGVQSEGGSLDLSDSSTRRSAVTWSASVGYQASSFFAVEASYIDLGPLTYEATGTETALLGASALSADLKISSQGPALALVGILPVTDALEISGRVGAYEGRTTTDYSTVVAGTPYTGTLAKTSTSLLLGAGAQYAISGHWALRVDYVYINRAEEKFLDHPFNVDLATAGIVFAF